MSKDNKINYANLRACASRYAPWLVTTTALAFAIYTNANSQKVAEKYPDPTPSGEANQFTSGPSTVDCNAKWRSIIENSDSIPEVIVSNCDSDDYWSEPDQIGDHNTKVRYLREDRRIKMVFVDRTENFSVSSEEVVHVLGYSDIYDAYLVNGDYILLRPESDTSPTATESVAVETPEVNDSTTDDRSFNERNGLVEAVNTRYYSTECQIYRLAGGPSYYDAEKYNIVPDTIGLEYSSSQSDYCIYPVILVRK
jgi:hypothetical protein